MNNIFEKHKLFMGRMISAYKESPRGEICVWNANVISPTHGKIWYGDLNLNKDGSKLKEIAKELGEVLYVLREKDCRFDTESDSIDNLISKAVWNTEQ